MKFEKNIVAFNKFYLGIVLNTTQNCQLETSPKVQHLTQMFYFFHILSKIYEFYNTCVQVQNSLYKCKISKFCVDGRNFKLLFGMAFIARV